LACGYILYDTSNVLHHYRIGQHVAAALALLAILGTEGKNTDLGAHLFGFVYGSFLGLITEYLIGRRGAPGPVLNALLAVLSVAVVVGAWWMAILQ